MRRVEGLRPLQRSWPSRSPTAAGSLAASPAPLLPDNPKPTTRPRPRALTGRRGRGRAPTAPPASRAPAPPRCCRGVAASAGEAPWPAPLSRRASARATLRPSARPCVRPFGSSRRRLPAARGSRPGLLFLGPPGGARPAAWLERQTRCLPLGPRASSAGLSARLSV